MEYGSLDFFSEDVNYSLSNPDAVKAWIFQIAELHGCKIENLSIVFCSDEYLLEMNKEHLGHDYYTDILTFPFHEKGTKWLMGDIFISIDRVRENADERSILFFDELHRVIIHGILHLVGFNDKSREEENDMRRLEDEALKLRGF